MLVKYRLPKTLLWVFNLMIIYLIMFTFFRLVTFMAFEPEGDDGGNFLPSFLMGLRYDLRWISFLLLPIVLVSLKPQLSPFYSLRNKTWWTWYLAIVTFFVIFFFAADFGCFSYNKTRLNASALNFAEDPAISLLMLWQSYPMFWLMLGLMVAFLLLKWMFRKSHVYIISKTEGLGIPYRRKWFVAAIVILAFFTYGSFNTQPLRWKNAFALQDGFKSYLALNPLQNFFTTLKFRKVEVNTEKAKDNYTVITDLVNLQTNNFTYSRLVTPNPASLTTNPNVVLVFAESFSMYKSSMSGNPLNTTPFFQSIADKGVFYERCFTPHFSTARGLFATVTGIPDVQLSKFSTRNQQALNQHSIINNFTGYEKFYFLGGSPSFNNFEGLLKNIEGLNMYTEGKFESKPVNVWGISDKDLFLEANKVLSNQTKPFFAIIQTADNHRPFMIPEGEKEFVKKNVHKDTLEKYGFESVEEYNSFRYADFAIQKFMEAAQKEAYFENTVFVFVGDHGVSGNAKAMYPEVWTTERLTDEHVPLLFYAPKMLIPQRRKEVVSQIDVLPSIAGLTGKTYINSTLGRDVLTQKHKNNFAFIISHDAGKIGMVTDDFYFTKNLNFEKEELHYLETGKYYTKSQLDSVKNKLTLYTTAFYETAKWMLVNNKKDQVFMVNK